MLSNERSEHKTVKVKDRFACDAAMFFPSSSNALHYLFCIVNGMSEKYAIAICYTMRSVSFPCLYIHVTGDLGLSRFRIHLL